MRIRFTGTAGATGWPAPGCRCASCNRAAEAPRRPLEALVDGTVPIGPGGLAGAPPAGYRAAPLACGTLLEGPDGARLLCAPPAGPDGADLSGAPGGPVDLALVDAARPELIGALRRSGVLDARSGVAVVGGGHGVHSPAEFARRAALWGAEAVADGDALDVLPGGPGRAAPGARASARPRRVLVTGGARSGKSSEAERRLLAEPEVVYVATGPAPDGDADWAARVAAHRGRRPPWWGLEETLDAAGALDRAAASGSAVLLDCAGTWLAGVMGECGMWEEEPPADAGQAVEARIADLLSAWERFPGLLVAVTNEVGSGVVPATRSGGLFRDLLGRLNQRLAAASEEVLLAAAGRIIELP
ncbi:bifunctional adenosylcobinamide kinase/adenosylcobinamide-phosphate guanylyltransferase [Nocardiopsis potens]|uniref:bifunctional adenosylcobinamide kinase/adenosylcobinamide-phosphate guanylyltransferase n=1 Tax=Nocardiopsis potens TaxID=1246458 RepID=UPI00034775CB|nr:bifunctional adenosylcobinamide kinase/adenosylcobinamide-phosphate guanylyltransferase [Nocardiopsis potens]